MHENTPSRRDLLKRGGQALGGLAVVGNATASDSNERTASTGPWGGPDVEITRFLCTPTIVEESAHEVNLSITFRNNEPDPVTLWGRVKVADNDGNEYVLDPTPNDTLMEWNSYYIETDGLVQGWYQAPIPVSMEPGAYGVEFTLCEERGGDFWGTPIGRAFDAFSYGIDASPACVDAIREWSSYQNDEFVMPAGVASDLVDGGVGGNCDFSDNSS